MTGLGLHMTQTAGLALASDRADDATRPRVVALLYVMFLVGMGVSSLVIGWLLRDFTPFTLIRVVQGAAVVGILLNLIALWRQENVKPMTREERAAPRPRFREAWADLMAGGQAGRLLAVVFLGTMAFNMQDVLLEPYGGEILRLSVSATTLLTAMWALGALIGFALAARVLSRNGNPYRMAGIGLLAGVMAFSIVIFAAPMQSTLLFYIGAGMIGFGAGYFAVSTLTAAMTMPAGGLAGRGLVLGAGSRNNRLEHTQLLNAIVGITVDSAAEVTIENSVIAYSGGSAISAYQSDVTIRNSVFHDNFGNAIQFAKGGTLTMEHSTIANYGVDASGLVLTNFSCDDNNNCVFSRMTARVRNSIISGSRGSELIFLDIFRGQRAKPVERPFSTTPSSAPTSPFPRFSGWHLR